jgi:hypothetical protein
LESGGRSYVRTPLELQELLQEQYRIGRRRFLEGRLLKLWAIKQQQYYDARRSCRTGRRWATALIQKLWDTAWDLWEHQEWLEYMR